MTASKSAASWAKVVRALIARLVVEGEDRISQVREALRMDEADQNRDDEGR